MAIKRSDTNWCGWGWANTRYDFHGQRDTFLKWLGKQLGADLVGTHIPPVNPEDVLLPDVRLNEADLADLIAAAGGQEFVQQDHMSRLMHSMGRSLPDLLRLRRGDIRNAPDAVVLPTSNEAVADILRLCVERNWAVVPFGGGSSVVGGVEAWDPQGRPVICLDMTKMNRILAFDPENQTATFQAGIYGPDLEAELAKTNHILGHYPQSFEFSTLGGWIAARSSGQQSNQYGDIHDMLESCVVITPKGELVTWTGPVSAAGPDLDMCIAGSEGTLGVIVEATVRIRPKPEAYQIKAVLFPDFAAGTAALRAISQADLKLSYMRLSDAVETATYLKMGSGNLLKEIGLKALSPLGFKDQKCVALIGTEGSLREVEYDVSRAIAICRAHGGLSVGSSPTKNWHRDRYLHPYMRDDLLDAGIATDTHETAVPWSKIGVVQKEVQEALESELGRHGKKVHVMAHLSHSYPTGSCIYFILMYPLNQDDPIGQWRPIKAAISDAIAKHGGTISHHHRVGIDHKPWLSLEKGELGLSLIKAVRREADPSNIMNPGKLVD